jgi:hypothetical protein
MLSKLDLEILKKINKYEPINKFLQCHEGIHTGNARDILFKKDKENEHCKPLFYGGGAGDIINNYMSFGSGWYVDYRKSLIDKRNSKYASLRDERIFKFPKIYITRTGNPFKSFLDKETYASNNFFSLQFLDYSKNNIESLKLILPFITSKLPQYFIRTFAAPRLGNTFVETKIIHLLKFKIPKISDNQKENILKIVDCILEVIKYGDYAKNLVMQAKVREYEEQIDQMVYKLYGLTEEEIKAIESH